MSNAAQCVYDSLHLLYASITKQFMIEYNVITNKYVMCIFMIIYYLHARTFNL